MLRGERTGVGKRERVEGVLLEAVTTVPFSTPKALLPFLLTKNPNFVQESGCDLVISRRGGRGRVCNPVLTTYKGKAAEVAPGETCSPDRTGVPEDLPSLLPAGTVGMRCWRRCVLCTLRRKAGESWSCQLRAWTLCNPWTTATNCLCPDV